MRTILTLILICLLNRFTLVECVGTHMHPECGGKVYICYVPAKCVSGSVPITGSDTKLLDFDRLVFDNCPAIFRYIAYNKQLVHVSIESLDSTTTSIEFRQFADPTKKIKFSCSKNPEGKFIGQYGKVSTENFNKDANAKLKCLFEAKTIGKATVFVVDGKNAQFKINNEETDEVSKIFSENYRCDPKKIYFNETLISSKKIAAVSYTPEKPGIFKCENPYRLEYKKEDSSEYKPVSSFTCSAEKFSIEGELINPDEVDSINIRCSADVENFCNFVPNTDPMPPGNEKPNLIPANVNAKALFKLECPSTHPHLVIDGVIKPIEHAKFKCVNRGGNEMYWAVGDYNFAKKGRPVSCTKELDCQRMHKILDSSVYNGKIDNDGFPMCFDKTGTMFVNDVELTDHKCDKSTGKFQYSTGEGQNKTYAEVREDTKFKCEYPKRKDEQANIENRKKLIASNIIVIVLVVIIGVAMTVFLIYCTSKRIKKRKEQIEEDTKQAEIRDDIAWQKFCMDKNEKKIYLAEKQALLEKNPDLELPDSEPIMQSVYKLSRMHILTVRTSVKAISYDTAIKEGRKPDLMEPIENEAILDPRPTPKPMMRGVETFPGQKEHEKIRAYECERKMLDWRCHMKKEKEKKKPAQKK